MDNVEQMWNTFSAAFRDSINKNVPTKTFNKRKADQPRWLNKHAEKLLAKQRKTYNKHKSTGDPFYLKRYKQERRENKRAFRKMKRDYFLKRICQPMEKGDTKPFFRHLRHVNGNTRCDQISLTHPDGTTTDDHMRCAETLNHYFQQQFCESENINNLLPLHVPERKLKIAPDGIENLILKLKNNKSPGPDLIRKCELLIDPALSSRCLTQIFQVSIDSGKLPTAWKLANVTPVFKKGKRDQPCNYRPISLTSIPCKMLEHIVLHYLNATLDKVLNNRQHGFRSGLSCETQLCSTFHDLAQTAEKSRSTHALILDFKKAFDKVPHRLLMDKIRLVNGIDPQIVNWIQDFLTNRTQQVVIRGTHSTQREVTSGVPQGSVLGPTLFLIYINDLPHVVKCQVSLYADDTLLYAEVQNKADEQSFQTDIDAVYQWSLKWKMPFNLDKCEMMIFGNTNTVTRYTLGEKELTRVDATKYLGVCIQADLKFNTHITEKMSKATKILGCIKHSLYDAPQKAKLVAYTSLCRPVLEYADTVWDPSDKRTIHDIEMVQRKVPPRQT